MARRAASEVAFATAVASDEGLNAKFGGLLEKMALSQDERRDISREFGAFLALSPASGLSSATERRALAAVGVLEALASGRDAAAALKALGSIPDLPPELERNLLAARLRDLRTYLGADDPLVQASLSGQDPDARAAAMLESSILDSGAELQAALDAKSGLSDDPAIQWIRKLLPGLQAYQSAAAGLAATEQAIASRLGLARFEVYGTSFPPDATFSLRISDGRVRGYEYNGTLSSAFTTLFGLYDRHFSHEGEAEWALPPRWLEASTDLTLSTPVNFVSTSDITGGNSGSPVVNRNLELVGLIFDGNIESLSGDFIYLDETQRSVSVDVRGILQALSHVYGAERLVSELQTGRLAEPEPEGARQ
jgi:peptidase S46-like protein